MPTVGDATIQVLADTSPAEKAFAGFVSDLGKLLTKSGKDLSKQLAPKPDASFGKSTIAAAGKVGAQAGAALSQGVKAGFGKTPTGLIVPSDLVNPAKQAGTQAGKVSADAVARSFETTARTGMKRAGDKAGKDAGDAVTKQAEKGGKEAGRRLSKGFEQIVAGGILLRVFDQFGDGFKKVFNEIDDGADSLVILMGAAGQKIEKIATSVSRAVVQGLDISKPATASIAVQLGLTGKALQETSIDLLDFSRITGTDVNQNIRGLDTALQGFSLTGADARNVMGQLILEMQHSGTPVDELLSRLGEFGPLLRSMNLDFDDSVKAIGALRGEDVSAIFEGLRFATLLAAGATEKATEDVGTLTQAVADLGVEIKSLEEDSKTAGAALAEAMKPATADQLAEATIGVERARLGQRDAARAVAEAERDLAAVEARGATNAAELQREERNLARARINHQNAIDRIADAERRLDEIRLGLSGTMRTLKDQELSLEGARLGVKDAADRVEDSEKALKDARKTGDAEAISDAERDLAHARLDQKQAIQSQSDEEKRLQLARQDAAKGDGQKADAERDLASAHIEEQEAAAAQRDQESKIAQLRSADISTTSELAAAQDKLAGARLNARSSTIDLHRSESELQTVREQGSAKDPAVIQALKDQTKATDDLVKKQRELVETQDAITQAKTVIGLDPELINRTNAAIAALGPNATQAEKAAAALKELSAGRALSPRLVARLEKLSDAFARGKIDAKNFEAEMGDATGVVGTLEGETHDLNDTLRETINTLKSLNPPGPGDVGDAFGILAPVTDVIKWGAALSILGGTKIGGKFLSKIPLLRALVPASSGAAAATEIGAATSALGGSAGLVATLTGAAGAAPFLTQALAVIIPSIVGTGIGLAVQKYITEPINKAAEKGNVLADVFTNPLTRAVSGFARLIEGQSPLDAFIPSQSRLGHLDEFGQAMDELLTKMEKTGRLVPDEAAKVKTAIEQLGPLTVEQQHKVEASFAAIVKVADIGGDVGALLREVVSGAYDPFGKSTEELQKRYGGSLDAMSKATGKAGTEITSHLAAAGRNIGTSLSGALETAATNAEISAKERGGGIGRALIDGLGVGLQQQGDSLTDKLKGVLVGTLVGTVKRLLGIGSPSKVFQGFGQNIVEGLIVGIGDRRSALDSATGALLSFRTPSIGELQTLSRSSLTSSALSSSTRAMARDDHSVTFGDVIIQHSETPEATARIFMNRVARAMTR